MNNTTKMVIGAVVIAGVFFYGGYAFAAARSTSGNQMRGAYLGNGGTTGGFRGMGGIGGRQGGGLTTGSIIARDGESVTVKMQDGGSRIVFYSGSTQVMKAVAGSAADLAIGQNVVIMGTQNSDGSITAQSIQLRSARIATSTSAQ